MTRHLEDKDTRTVWEELGEVCKSSMAGEIRVQKISTHLTSIDTMPASSPAVMSPDPRSAIHSDHNITSMSVVSHSEFRIAKRLDISFARIK